MTLLSDTELQLQQNVDTQQPLFSHIDVGDISSCFAILDGPPPLVLSNAQISINSDQLNIMGQLSLPGIDSVAIQATCTEVDGALALNLLARLPGNKTLTIPGLTSVGIDNMTCSLVTQPIVNPLVTTRILNNAIAGTFLLGNLHLPITLSIPGDNSDWVLQNTDTVSLPSLTDLTQLVGDPAILDALPSELETLGHLSLSDLSLSFNPTLRTISSVTLGITTDQSLAVIPSVLSIDQIKVLLYVNNPIDAATRAFGAIFTSLIQLEGEQISVSAEIPSLLLTGSIAPDPGLNLSALIQQLLPQGITLPPQVPAIILSDLTLKADPRAHAFSLYTRSYLDWAIVPNIFTIRSLEANLQRDATGTQAEIAGSLEIAGVDVSLSAAIDQHMTLSGMVDTVSLAEVVAHFFDGSALPPEIPAVSLTNVNVSLTPSTGAFSLTGEATAQWDFGTGGQVVTTQLALDLKRTPAPEGAFECTVTLNATGPLQIAEGVELDSLQFAFSRSSAADWTLAGTVTSVLFDTSLTLSATYIQSATDKKLQLATLLSSPHDLITLPGIGGLNVTSIAVELDRQTGSPTEKSLTSWNVSANGRFHADNVCDLPGTLELYKKSDGSAGLNFVPANAHASIPLTAFSANDQHASLDLNFGGITISRTASQPGGKSGSWSFDSALQFSFLNLPTDITHVLPIPAQINASFSATSSSVTLTADRLLAPVDFKIPDIEISQGLTIPLGNARLDLTNLSISLGHTVQLSVVIGVGLPSHLNNLFGTSDGRDTPRYAFFNTFDPSQPDTTTIQVQLSADEKSISLVPQSSPIKAIQPTKMEDGTSWWNCDLGESGSFRIEVPVFSYNPSDSSFAASGAFVINQDPPLQIPLGSIKRMLGKMGTVLPAGLPIRGLSLLDAHGNLNVDAVLNLLPAGTSFDTIRQVLTDIANVVDRLPDNFKEYLEISIPQDLSFSISTSPEGSLRFDVNADPQHPLKIMYPTIAILPPNPAPAPALYGIQLRSLSFGPLSGGSLFQLQIDAVFDQFDLITLGTSLLLPQDGSVPLPTSRDLQRRFIIKKLFMIIVYEDVIPIPIPVFYEQLGMEYMGIEGVAVQAHASFPMPQTSFKEAAQLFSDLKQFFTDKAYFLPTDPAQAPLKTMNLVFSLSKDYIQAPKYLSNKVLGIPNDGPALNLYQTIATLLNGLKRLTQSTLTFDEVLQLIPLDYRIGQDQFSFGPLSFSSAWLVTTPSEFQQGAYKRLPAYQSQAQAPMDDFNAVIRLPNQVTSDPIPLLPGNEVTHTASGLIALLRGQANLGSIVSFTSIFGLAASSTQGFQIGLQLNGKIANLFDADLGGYVALHLPQSASTSTHAPVVAAAAPQPVSPTSAPYALSFDGKGSYLDIPSFNLQPVAFTVEWWLNPRSHHDFNQCIAATNNWGAFVFHTTETGAVYVGTDGTTRFTPNEIKDGTIELNKWQHFAFTFDHGTGCFYKNGTLLATKTGMGPSTPWGGFRLGLPTTGTIDGLINEVRVWKRALPALDIQTRMYSRVRGNLPGLLGCWSCDEGITALAPDKTGQNMGMQVGTTWVSPGPVKLSGLLFDGQKSYVDAPSLNLQPTAFTVEWWLNPRSHHDFNQCLAATNNWGAFVFHTTEAGAVYVGTDAPTRLTPNEIKNGTVELNKWQHFAFTFDHGTGCFYKNGTLLATKTGMAPSAPWGGFRLGLPSAGTIDGQVDEVRIWNRALPVQEIQAGLLNLLSGNEAGLQAYWRFNQGSGLGVQDVAHQNAATLINTSWAEPPMVALSGLLFDRQQSYVEVPALTWQPVAFTVEWWLNPLSHHDFNQCIAATNNWGAFVFHTTETGAVYVGTDGTTRLTPNEIGNGTIEWNKWQHFAFTFDHGTGCFYKNGILLATKTGMANPAPWGGFRLGLPTANTIDGQVDEVRIWSRALPAQEILTYKDSQRSGSENGLYGYWRFGANTGSTITDLTQNAWQANLINVHVSLPQVPGALSNATFQLEGHCSLSLLNNRIFGGDLQVTNTSFWTKGGFALFPAQFPLLQVGGHLQGWISQERFYLAGDATVRLFEMTMSQATVILSNDLILLNGTCLGVTTTLNVRPQSQELVVSGIIQPKLQVSVDLGQIAKASHIVAKNLHLDLDVTALLAVTISRSGGFVASVTAKGQYNGKSLTLPTFTLTVAPSDLASLAVELAKRFKAMASQLFDSIFSDAQTWLQGILSGAIQWAIDAYQDMGHVLKDIFNQSLAQTVVLLNTIGKTTEEIGQTVYGIYTTSLAEVTIALKNVNALADQVGHMLKKVFLADTYEQISKYYTENTPLSIAGAHSLEQQVRSWVTLAFKQANYSDDSIGSTLVNMFSAGANEVALAFISVGATADQVGNTLKNVFNASAGGAAQALHVAGYTIDQIGNTLYNEFTHDSSVAASALRNAGFGATESMRVLKQTFNASLDVMILSLRDYWGLTRSAVWDILTSIGYSVTDLTNEIAKFF